MVSFETSERVARDRREKHILGKATGIPNALCAGSYTSLSDMLRTRVVAGSWKEKETGQTWSL